MKHLLAALAALGAAAWLAACSAPLPPEDGPPTRAVHVLSNGWHTAIVVPRAEVVATGRMPEAGDFPDAPFLAFGWGDREYYPAEAVTLGRTLRAALLPTAAVMHVAPRSRPPAPGPGREVLRLALTEAGMERLVAAIAGDIERAPDGRAAPVAPGLSPGSAFYPARGRFHLFNTCNTWTARMLRAGGIAVAPAGVITADDVMDRLRAANRRVRLSMAGGPRPGAHSFSAAR